MGRARVMGGKGQRTDGRTVGGGEKAISVISALPRSHFLPSSIYTILHPTLAVGGWEGPFVFRLNENAKASTGPSPRNAFFDPRTHRNSFFIIHLFCVSQQCRRRGSPPLSVPEAADAPDLRRGRRPLRRSLAAARGHGRRRPRGGRGGRWGRLFDRGAAPADGAVAGHLLRHRRGALPLHIPLERGGGLLGAHLPVAEAEGHTGNFAADPMNSMVHS